MGGKQSKTKNKSQARRRANKIIARIHERIRNRRHNFVHQLARQFINRFGTISVEKLNVVNMSRRPKPVKDAETGTYLPNGASAKSGLNKSIMDASWSQFRSILTQKAASAARKMIEVNPAYTSQDCSTCGYRVRKMLKERVHSCPNGCLVLDRDHNATINIIGQGLLTIGNQSVEAAWL